MLLHSMCHVPGQPRNLHLYAYPSSIGNHANSESLRYASQNQLAKSHDKLVDCIQHSITPLRMTLRMIDYQKEEPFRELLYAIARNRNLEFLDISKVSLPYDASDETCMVLKDLFQRNTSLKHLDISGEQAVLETSTLGTGLNKALAGLSTNTTLEVLKVEHQSLGSSGAMVLADILTRNTTLRELHCSKNKINLQGFTALVDSLAQNTTLFYLPTMDPDRVERIKSLKESFKNLTDAPKDSSPSILRPSTLRKKKTTKDASASARRVSFRADPVMSRRPALVHRMSSSLASLGLGEEDLGDKVVSAKDAEELVKLMEQKWGRERERLAEYLERNVRFLESESLGEKGMEVLEVDEKYL